MRAVTALIVMSSIALGVLAERLTPATEPGSQPATPRRGAATKPARPAVALEPALEKYARGEYAAAAGMLEGPYKEGPTSIQHRLILARAYIHVGRRDEALAVLKSVHADDKENGEANTLTGGLLLERGQAAEALEFLQTAHRLKKDATTASALGRCYWVLGPLAKAKPLLEEAAATDVRNPDNSFILGKICLARGLGALAQRHLLAAQEAGLDSQEFHLLLLRAYLMQEKFVGPIVVRRLPGAPQAAAVVEGMLVLGPVPGRPGEYRLCEKLCGLYEGCQVLRRDPKNAEGLYAAARGWLAAAELEQAANPLAELTAVEPDTRRVLDLRGKMLIAKKDFAGVQALLAKPGAVRAFGPEGLATLSYRAGMVLRGDGRREEALAMFAQAEKLQPVWGQVMRATAGLLMAMGKRDEARRYYARMVEMFPDAADIDELRNQLKNLGGAAVEEAKDDTQATDATDVQGIPAVEIRKKAPVVPATQGGRNVIQEKGGDE